MTLTNRFTFVASKKLKAFPIEDPCSKLQGIFDRKECGLFYDSLAYPAASGGECARSRGSGMPQAVSGQPPFGPAY
jgi:hypothetical protein